MLDINFIRKNQELVEKSAREKGYQVDIPALLALDDERKSTLQTVEELRQRRNELSSRMKGGKPDPELIAQAKEVKEKLAELEPQLSEI